MVVPTSPDGPSTMSQLRPAISPARSPDLTDSRTMIRFRSGYLVAPTYVRRCLKCLSDRILACLPAIAVESQFDKQSHNIVRMTAMQFELFAREHDIATKGLLYSVRTWLLLRMKSSGSQLKSILSVISNLFSIEC